MGVRTPDLITFPAAARRRMWRRGAPDEGPERRHDAVRSTGTARATARTGTMPASRAGELAACRLHRRVAAARLQGHRAARSTSATASTTCTTSASSTRRARSARSTARSSSTCSAVRALQRAGIQVYADAVLNHRIGGRRDRGRAGHALPAGRPAAAQGRAARDRGLHALPLRRPQRQVLGLRVARAPLRRRRLRSPQSRREEHGLPDRRQEVRRPGGARERQLLVPDGRRPRLRQPGGARRGDGLGQVVPRHDRRRRLPARRGEAHRGLVLSRVARRDGGPREEGPVRRRASTGRRTSTRCTGISTASAAASRCSACRSTTTSTTRAGRPATTTCAACSRAR